MSLSLIIYSCFFFLRNNKLNLVRPGGSKSCSLVRTESSSAEIRAGSTTTFNCFSVSQTGSQCRQHCWFPQGSYKGSLWYKETISFSHPFPVSSSLCFQRYQWFFRYSFTQNETCRTRDGFSAHTHCPHVLSGLSISKVRNSGFGYIIVVKMAALTVMQLQRMITPSVKADFCFAPGSKQWLCNRNHCRTNTRGGSGWELAVWFYACIPFALSLQKSLSSSDAAEMLMEQ